jgi:adenine/guanine phosphoribosyltransferase-like PRPP-binding protein
MLVFNNYFYKNSKSKLYFGDRVAVLNDFIYQTGGSTTTQVELIENLHCQPHVCASIHI